MRGIQYTEAELQYVKAMYGRASAEAIGRQIGRTQRAISNLFHSLGISKNHPHGRRKLSNRVPVTFARWQSERFLDKSIQHSGIDIPVEKKVKPMAIEVPCPIPIDLKPGEIRMLSDADRKKGYVIVSSGQYAMHDDGLYIYRLKEDDFKPWYRKLLTFVSLGWID